MQAVKVHAAHEPVCALPELLSVPQPALLTFFRALAILLQFGRVCHAVIRVALKLI